MIGDSRLKIFMEVIAQGGFTKAAESLGLSQSTVSQNIAELERQCGRRLFERHKSDFALTDEGYIFKGYAEKVLAAYDEMSRALVILPSAVVRIAVSDELWETLVSSCLVRFMTLHPQVVFERSLPDEADLSVRLERCGSRFEIVLGPSDTFAATPIWTALEGIIKSA